MSNNSKVSFEVVPVRVMIDQFAQAHNAKGGSQIRQSFYDPERQAVILHVEVEAGEDEQ